VEDEDLNWEIAAKRLHGKFELHRAKDSREAFEKLRHRAYDLVLMDIQLSNSEYDGIAMTEILTNRYSGVTPTAAEGLPGKAPPIIFVTAYTARYTREELREHGADEMIAKPVDFIQLVLVMSRLIARRTLA
ncbi:MAG TPA: response regulator, partial [Myxococcota bacterium]|nr:response regulator [Myxococcota bacterium]